MKLHHQFLQLHAQFGTNEPQEATEVTLDDLASILDCTHRTALTVIHKMEELAWIDWVSRRGRGARSKLRFRVSPEDIAAQFMMDAIRRKDVQQAIQDIRKHADTPSLQDQLQGWLLSYFGHRAEIRSNRKIDTLRLPIRQPLHTIDPLNMNLLAESFIASHVFDGLVGRDSESGDIIPAIAHAWERNESGTEWTFHLRKGVVFHNGRLLTPEDVVYTFERLANSSGRSLYSAFFRLIQDVQIVNPVTIRMVLKEPCELFLPSLSTTRASIVPRNLGERSDVEFGLRPIGTGPFKLTGMQKHVCVLESFPHYYHGQAHLDRVEIVHVPWRLNGKKDDANDTLSLFHVIPGQPATSESPWTQLHSEVRVRKFVTCNTRKDGPLRNPHIRAAIMAALREQPETSTIQDLLDPDSLADLRPLHIATITPYQDDADRVAQRLTQYGFTCQVLSSTVEEFKGDIRLHADLIMFSLLRDQDEQLRFYDLYKTMAEHVEPNHQRDMLRSLSQVAGEPKPETRAELLLDMERRLTAADELFILSEKPLQTAFLPSIRGMSFNSQGWVDLRHLWFPPSG
ncbi:ABC transporter substrate-binding protein [Paenibacillus senegalimassiliensis]|uniref:ABC transporter substrate-binding protein n=1 Tax=Paenibacillus senegalimassiliensis TaxID=1737426 RepID=UPI00073E8D9C|nr:ABC transporter substrate-binding protein [Paenibacillus senegalimassiliensis]